MFVAGAGIGVAFFVSLKRSVGFLVMERMSASGFTMLAVVRLALTAGLLLSLIQHGGASGTAALAGFWTARCWMLRDYGASHAP